MKFTYQTGVRAKLGRVKNHLERYLKYGDWWFPMVASIELGTYCNRSCSYCPNSAGLSKKPGRMTDETFLNVVCKLGDVGFSGGISYHQTNEPLYDKRLEYFIKLTKEQCPRSKPTVVTNGDVLTINRAKSLIEAGVSKISVSRHAPFSEQWDAKITEIQNYYPSYVEVTQVGKTVEMHTYEYATEKGLDWQGKCLAPTLAVLIGYAGDVRLCCADYMGTTSYGNLNEKGFLEIWNSPKFVFDRKLLRSGLRVSKICMECSGII